jgi:hypothetical protein
LEALFPEVPEDAAILLWTLRGRRSVWCTDVDAAADKAVEIADDVYVGACLGPRSIMDDPLASKKRAKKDQVVALSGFCLDIDFQHQAHQKQNLPPNLEAARHLLDLMPLKPTAIVMTGHGLHGWWLSTELVELDSAEERARIEALHKGWNELLRRKAEVMGWTVDSTWDLARVMRVPGTRNCKGDQPIDCELLELNDCRYNLDDLEEYTPQVEAPVSVQEPGRQRQSDTPSNGSLADEQTMAFTVAADASPPAEKLMVAITNDGTFKDTFGKERRDLKDQSLSAYDQSLADQAVGFGWTDQEIVNLLIAFRRGQGKPKLRRDYFVMTLTKARRAVQAQEADERIEELAAITQAAAETNTLIRDGDKSDAFREEALKTLTQMFGFRVHAVEKTKSAQPLYIIKTDHGRTTVGGIGAVMSPAIFKQRIADATGIVLGKRKKGTWDSVAQVILNAVVEVDVGPEATDEGAATAWISGYLSDNPPLNLDKNPDEGSRDFYPAIKTIAGRLSICLDVRDLRQWVKVAHGYGDRITQRDLGVCLRAIGAESKSVRLYAGEEPVRRWVIEARPELLPAHANTKGARIVTPSGGDVTDPPDPSVTGTDPGKMAN